VILEPGPTMLDEAPGRVVVICRHPGRRVLLEHLVPSPETHTSAMEALLAVARRRPKAIVLNLEDVEGRERDLVAALRRARPETPIYALVKPEDEPLGRRLLKEGASDYFVLPSDVNRLPMMLAPPKTPVAETPPAEVPVRVKAAPAVSDTAPAPPPQPAAAAPAEVAAPPTTHDVTTVPAPQVPAAKPERGVHQKAFEAACAMAWLAVGKSAALLSDGSLRIMRAMAADRACLFVWNDSAKQPDLAAAWNDVSAVKVPDAAAEKRLAERVFQTGKTLFLLPGAEGLPSGRDEVRLCVPLRSGGQTFGVLNLAIRGGTDAAARSELAGPAGQLAEALARLYGAAVQREEFARLALRDPETGLLKAATFETYLEKVLVRAATHGAEVGVVILEPAPDEPAPSAEVLGRLGHAIQDIVQANGYQGGRLDTGRYAVVLSRRTEKASPDEEAKAFYAAAAKTLAALGPQVDETLRLRTGVAVFPRDAGQVKTLLAAAEERLTG